MPSVDQAKSMAKALESVLRRRNIAVSHSECLEIVAQQAGYRDWNVLSAKAKQEEERAQRRIQSPKAWNFIAEYPTVYDHGVVDDAHGAEGTAALIRLRSETAEGRYPEKARAFGCYTQIVSAEPFHGKRLEIKADLRSEGVAHGATIWARVDRLHGQHLAFDNLKNGPGGWLFGDVSWAERRIVIDVPPHAMSLYFGFFLKGYGAVWAANFQVSIAESTAILTAEPVERTFTPTWLAPSNLAFTEVSPSTGAEIFNTL